MARNVKINGVTYENVPSVTIPNAAGGGSSEFFDTTGANGAAGDLLTGKKMFGASGEVNGTMAENGAVSGEIYTKDGEYTVPAGHHNGSGKVGIAAAEKAKILSANIKAGVSILGVSGSSSVVDTSDADAAAGTILSGKTAYVNGSKITGVFTAAVISQDSTTKVLSVS